MGKILVILMVGSLFASAYYAVGIVLLLGLMPVFLIQDIQSWSKQRQRDKLKEEMIAIYGEHFILPYCIELENRGIDYGNNK